MSASRRKGTAAESAVVDYLKSVGFPYAERRALSGSKDRGDVAGLPGVVIEVKSAARVELSEWLKEAEVEKHNANASVGVVWAKRKGKGSPGDWFVIMTGAQFIALLEAPAANEEAP